MITIKEIAQLAGVSIGTVDRVIHTRGRVSKDNVAKITDIIKKHGYKTNTFARNLVLSRTLTIAVLMPHPDNDSSYWRGPAAGIKKAQMELKNVNIAVRFHYFDRSDTASFVQASEKLLKDPPSALLIAPVLPEQARVLLDRLDASIPYASFDSELPETTPVSFYGQDAFQSGVVAGKLMSLLVQPDLPCIVVQAESDGHHHTNRAGGFIDYMWRNGRPKPERIILDDADSSNPDTFARLLDKNTVSIRSAAGICVTNASSHLLIGQMKASGMDVLPRFVGYDLTQGTIPFLQDGTIDFVLSQRPETQGYESVYALYRHLMLGDTRRTTSYVPIDIITRENMNQYLDTI